MPQVRKNGERMKIEFGYLLAILITIGYVCFLIADWRECNRRGGTFLRAPFYFECVQVLKK